MFGWIKDSAVYEAGLIGAGSWDEESSSYKVQLPAGVLQEAARVTDKGYLFYVHGTIEAEGTESEFYLRANKMEANRILFAEGSSLTEGLLTISHFDLTHVETEVADLMNDVTDLKTAIDERAPIGIVNKANMLLSAPVKYGYYYAAREYVNASFRYYIVPIEKGVTYKVCGARYLSSADSILTQTINAPTDFTATYTGNLYVSVANSNATGGSNAMVVFFCLASEYENVGGLAKPTFNPDILAQTLGESTYIPASQKLVQDVVDAQKQKENEEEWLSPTALIGFNLGENSSFICKKTEGKYVYNVVGDTLYVGSNANMAYKQIDVSEGTYYFNKAVTFACVYDSDNKCVVSYNRSSDISINVPANGVSLYLSTSLDQIDTLYVATSAEASEFEPVIISSYNIKIKSYDDLKSQLLSDKQNMFTLDLMRESACKVNASWYTTSTYAQFDTYWFYATAGKEYTIGCPCRFITVDNNTIYNGSSPVGYTYTPENDCIIYCSISKTETYPIKCAEAPATLDEIAEVGTVTLNPALLAQSIGTSTAKLMSQKAITEALSQRDPTLAKKLYGDGFVEVTGSLTDGQVFNVPKTNVKKNNVYSFACKVTSFSSLLIGHGKTEYESSYIEITTDNVILHNRPSTETTRQWAHGLSISGYLFVQIVVKTGTADIHIFSNGDSFTQQDMQWGGDGDAQSFAESVGSTLTDCRFSWSSGDFRKSVWAFGDSYFSFSRDSRWVYYLKENGYIDNVLLNAYPGENSFAAVSALNSMIENYGLPNSIVWCLGMNDGSDSNSSTPTSAWKSGIDTVLELCTTYGITPIFATIPTVPSIRHEGKNNWVRNSGHRYIDFAKAVGADGTGAWYSGMLSGDNVHPDTLGALALYYQAITDCPEFTYSNP